MGLRVLLVALIVWSAVATAKPPAKKGATPGHDIEVTLILATGARITYTSEVRLMQLVLNPAGNLDKVHLLLAKQSTDVNTHEWWVVSSLAGFSYRYLALTGRSKVQVVRADPFEGQEAVKEKIPVLRPDNYQ